MSLAPSSHIQNYLQFTKIQGAGNSFICIDHIHKPFVRDLASLAIQATSSGIGIGADGMIVMSHSGKATLRMALYNPDGSQAHSYGNSLRCAALYARAKGVTDSSLITVETDSGIMSARIENYSGLQATITVDMGHPDFNSPNLPLTRDTFGRVILTVGERAFTLFPVSIGEPHGVIFTDDLSDNNFLSYAPMVSRHSRWPKHAIVEFAKATMIPGTYEMRTWEPVLQETPACGTGACAVAAAAWFTGCKTTTVNLQLPGGTLSVARHPDSGNFLLTGPAAIVADGILYIAPTE